MHSCEKWPRSDNPFRSSRLFRTAGQVPYKTALETALYFILFKTVLDSFRQFYSILDNYDSLDMQYLIIVERKQAKTSV